jgi:hypothetical protein
MQFEFKLLPNGFRRRHIASVDVLFHLIDWSLKHRCNAIMPFVDIFKKVLHSLDGRVDLCKNI